MLDIKEIKFNLEFDNPDTDKQYYGFMSKLNIGRFSFTKIGDSAVQFIIPNSGKSVKAELISSFDANSLYGVFTEEGCRSGLQDNPNNIWLKINFENPVPAFFADYITCEIKEDSEYNCSNKLRIEFTNSIGNTEEVQAGVFNIGEAKSIRTKVSKVVIVSKDNKIYKPELKPIVPTLAKYGKARSTNTVNLEYTAEKRCIVMVHVEGGTANYEGNGQSTVVYTAPRDPIFDLHDNNTQGTGWYYSKNCRFYVLLPGETISVSARNPYGNNYTYCIPFIYVFEDMFNLYDIECVLKGYNANNSTTTYTHQPGDERDEFAFFVFMTTGGFVSAAAPTVSSTDDGCLVSPTIQQAVYISSEYAYINLRFFKLPKDKAFSISGRGNSTSNTRSPATCYLFKKKS